MAPSAPSPRAPPTSAPSTTTSSRTTASSRMTPTRRTSAAWATAPASYPLAWVSRAVTRLESRTGSRRRLAQTRPLCLMLTSVSRRCGSSPRTRTGSRTTHCARCWRRRLLRAGGAHPLKLGGCRAASACSTRWLSYGLLLSSPHSKTTISSTSARTSPACSGFSPLGPRRAGRGLSWGPPPPRELPRPLRRQWDQHRRCLRCAAVLARRARSDYGLLTNQATAGAARRRRAPSLWRER
mmetsp:Transcript_4418/g.12825  ORF Transcript_4418/g.12825 Transcript_4418/m.12825 type:complete len:239 (+) Transcript_4418:906-1622(+)